MSAEIGILKKNFAHTKMRLNMRRNVLHMDHGRSGKLKRFGISQRVASNIEIMNIEPTPYYHEFLRYYKMSKKQHELCNVSSTPPYGMIPHENSNIGDDLMEKVALYDVVERKFAGFSQINNDVFYGWTEAHPYWEQMKRGHVSDYRLRAAHDWTGKHEHFGIAEFLYIFLLHRVCGSGINYSQRPSGYYNTILFKLHRARTMGEMTEMVRNESSSFFTSVGYQFPQFPKSPSSRWKKGGDYYLCEFAPRLCQDLARWLTAGKKKDLREIGKFMLDWNVANGLKQYHFQYAATVADIADWYPQYVNVDSLFFYGSNATECISYMARPLIKMSTEQLLDEVMVMACIDTGGRPYDIEDVCCDSIRYMTNYVRMGESYDHLCRDTVWNSSKIIHPFGRQQAMLDLGLVKTFNDDSCNFFYDEVIRANNLTPRAYIKLVQSHPKYADWIGVPDKFSDK